ncbi:MAG: polysaccharide deacetylase family protein [Alphaproteobacteria bacterium]
MPAQLYAHNPANWSDLTAEFDAWAAAGRQADLWWRDDDATVPGPALDRLLKTADSRPLSLAVIPSGATRELVRFVDDNPHVAVLQHGYAHANHAPDGEKKSEFGDHRPLRTMLPEIVEGRKRLAGLFGNRFLSVFVPPWNRIADPVAAELGACGVRAISAFGRRKPGSVPRRLNCHVDIVNWRGNRGFLGAGPVLDTLVRLLAEIRTGAPEDAEPVGLLTHHRDHDDAGWRFLEDLFSVSTDHPGARWMPAATGIADG